MSDSTTPPDWASLRMSAMTAVGPADQIKRDLPIAFVLHLNSIQVDSVEGKLVAPCPFHQDSNPSLDVYGEGLQRWGCYPCGIGGDVLDFVEKFYGIHNFETVLRKCREIIGEIPEGWTPPVVNAVRKVFDVDEATLRVNRSQMNDPDSLRAFLAERRFHSGVTVEFLQDSWNIGSEDDRIVIPYYNRANELVAYKHRLPHTGKAMSAPGSSLTDVLYGEWRDVDHNKTVVLVEGESDAWAASYLLPPEYVVLGLAAGAGAHPKAAPSLSGRNVVVAFDGDEAGRKASLRWAVALRDEGAFVRVASVPDGEDLASMKDPVPTILNARVITPSPDGIIVDGAVFSKPGNEVPVPMCNWSLEPECELRAVDGTIAYEGLLLPQRKRVLLSSVDLEVKSRIVTWSRRNDAAWFGTDRDAQVLLGYLQSLGPFLSPGGLATVAGLHSDHFVWPGHVIGPDTWRYSPPVIDVHLGERMWVEPGEWTPSQIHALRDLHHHAITDPILAWLALAPLRTMFRQFPILSIMGSSGSGKTTLTETMVQAFSSTAITSNLTATTPHAVFGLAASSNAFPVWFDEYRPGARRDAIQTLNQILRDAYTGQASSKGGLGDRWAEVTLVPINAPIIVTGEDAFSETSHTERMIQVNLPREGRNPEALDAVQGWPSTGLAHAYLSWLQELLYRDFISPDVEPQGAPYLPIRSRYNIGLLHKGWNLLDEFVTAHGGESLGPASFQWISLAAQESSETSPIQDAILWALDHPMGDDVAMYDPESGLIHIRPVDFAHFVERNSSIPMPGSEIAIRNHVKDAYDGQVDRRRWAGKQVRTLSFPASRVGYEP